MDGMSIREQAREKTLRPLLLFNEAKGKAFGDESSEDFSLKESISGYVMAGRLQLNDFKETEGAIRNFQRANDVLLNFVRNNSLERVVLDFYSVIDTPRHDKFQELIVVNPYILLYMHDDSQIPEESKTYRSQEKLISSVREYFPSIKEPEEYEASDLVNLSGEETLLNLSSSSILLLTNLTDIFYENPISQVDYLKKLGRLPMNSGCVEMLSMEIMKHEVSYNLNNDGRSMHSPLRCLI